MRDGAAWHDEYLYNLSTAQMINRLHGGPVVAAWEVSQLDWLWQYALANFADLPRRQKPIMALKKRFAENQRKHPTYRK